MNQAEGDPEDFGFAAIWDACGATAAITVEHGRAIFQAVRFIHQNFLNGEFVLLGAGADDTAVLVIRALQHFGIANRKLWLPQETEPAAHDEVAGRLIETGYDEALIGHVSSNGELLGSGACGAVALLCSGESPYEATYESIERLFPLLVENGVLLISSYEYPSGSRRAFDAYFDGLVMSGQIRPYLHRIGTSGRMATKPALRRATLPVSRYDYHAPGLQRADLLGCFPELVARDCSEVDWFYLRKQVPHIWRSDTRARRQPNTGAISVEEAELLYNNALRVSGRRGIEVGCHYGWSTAHLVKAGIRLDVVDPALGDDHHFREVTSSLERVGGAEPFTLWPGYSPGVVDAVRATAPEPYSFAFVDGYHEGLAPQRDALAVSKTMAADACIMFHDLTSPYVAAGLGVLADEGWQTGIYNTMQVMGIAWRGDFAPVKHISDPNAPMPRLSHLSRFTMLSEPGPA